jgi:ATP-binding cassette subfamily F protein 3
MLEKMKEIAIPLEDRAVPFHFDDPDELASPLIALDEADLGYARAKPVLKDVSFRLDHDDRIVIIGPNGQGKSTLVKSIGGRLALLGGRRTASKQVRIGYFSQDQLDELRQGETVLQHVRDLAPTLTPARQRALAAHMGFGREKIDTAVEKLSGGEKVRLLLGLMAYLKPHVLILDEPTSHLDIDSREALIHALNEYSGAVILITHDVYLAEAVADRLWLVHAARARPYEGDLSDYRILVLNADRAAPQAKRDAPNKRAPRLPDAQAHTHAHAHAIKERLAETEKALWASQAALAAIDAELSNQDLRARDPTHGAALSQRRALAAAALKEAEDAWLAAAEASEEASPAP